MNGIAGMQLAHLAEETIDNRYYIFGAFRRWCDKQGLPALPAPEAVLLVYLRNEGLRWSANYRRSVVLAIDWAHESAGMTAPSGADTRGYLAALLRVQGANAKPPVHPLTEREVAAMVTCELAGSDDAAMTRARFAVLRAAALHGQDWTSFPRDVPALLGQPKERYTICTDRVTLALPAGPLSVEEARDPMGFAALTRVLASPHSTRGTVGGAGGRRAGSARTVGCRTTACVRRSHCRRPGHGARVERRGVVLGAAHGGARCCPWAA